MEQTTPNLHLHASVQAASGSPPAPVPGLSSGVFTDTPSHDIAVAVRGLSKSYSIARNAVRHTSAGEAIMHTLRHPFEKVERDTFWALSEVNFDIHKGDVVGIIGRNGAGKSTLLKILSRITEPTRGKIDLYGRVGSLLEVGTGFHPELTGRENIYLNGAILGMQKSEITRQFDEIVEFSGTEKFLDTPVKRYSSGMYVRLAFAVAAHLNPEILIIDEVLAVGDAEFQKKCMGKMHDVAESGRTVLFVSHNMAAIASLCSRGLLLKQGRVISDASAETCVSEYMSTGHGAASQMVWDDPSERPGQDLFRLCAVRVTDQNQQTPDCFRSSRSIAVEIEFDLSALHPSLCVGFDLQTLDGACVLRTFQTDTDESCRPKLKLGRNTLRCLLPAETLNAGVYAVCIRVTLHYIKWILEMDNVVQFEVIRDHGTSTFLKVGSRPGPIAPVLPWTQS